MSDERTVLEADYSIECATASTEDGLLWVAVAVLSFFGITLVSVGVPVSMWYRMNKVWKAEMQKANQLKISRVVAYRDFHRRFGYMSGDFKPEAYFAECVDLFRKLAMTGVLVLLAPGTIIQSFCSVLLAVFFLAVQIKLWPYPHLGANMLKAFTDLQIFLVTLVGLVLRINPDDLQKDPLSKGFILCVLEDRPCGDAGGDVDDVEQTAAASFYGDVLLTLLLLTLVPVVLSIFLHSDVQNAQRFLLEAGHVIEQPKKCCGNKKQENLLRRRVELRKRATVTSMKIDDIDLFELTNVEQAEFKLAVKRACKGAAPGCVITKVELLDAGSIIAKVYFETSDHKNLVESKVTEGIKIEYRDYAPYKAWPIDPDSAENRTRATTQLILGETLRESVAALQIGQEQKSAAAATHDDLYDARLKRLQRETEPLIDDDVEAPDDDETHNGDRGEVADDPPPDMPDARDSVMPEAQPPARRSSEDDADQSLKPTPRKELIEIYAKFNPRKVEDVDKLLSEWALKPGGIPKLLAKVRGKYQIDDPEAPPAQEQRATGKSSDKGQAFDDLGPLPKGWKTRMDPVKQRRCYYNRSTKQAPQWTRPSDPNAAQLAPEPRTGGGKAEEPRQLAGVEEDEAPPGMPDARDSVMPAPMAQDEPPRRTNKKKDETASVKHEM